MISSLVCNKFRARLSEELVVTRHPVGQDEFLIIVWFQFQKTSHHFAVVDDDERIAPLVKSLQLEHTNTLQNIHAQYIK